MHMHLLSFWHEVEPGRLAWHAGAVAGGLLKTGHKFFMEQAVRHRRVVLCRLLVTQTMGMEPWAMTLGRAQGHSFKVGV